MENSWKSELDRECYRCIDAGGGEVRIVFVPIKSRDRFSDEFKYIIRGYPDNQTTGIFKVSKLD